MSLGESKENIVIEPKITNSAQISKPPVPAGKYPLREMRPRDDIDREDLEVKKNIQDLIEKQYFQFHIKKAPAKLPKKRDEHIAEDLGPDIVSDRDKATLVSREIKHFRDRQFQRDAEQSKEEADKVVEEERERERERRERERDVEREQRRKEREERDYKEREKEWELRERNRERERERKLKEKEREIKEREALLHSAYDSEEERENRRRNRRDSSARRRRQREKEEDDLDRLKEAAEFEQEKKTTRR